MAKQLSISKITGLLYCLGGILTFIAPWIKEDVFASKIFMSSFSLTLFLIGIIFLKGERRIAILALVGFPIWVFFTWFPIALVTGLAGEFPPLLSQIVFFFFLVLLVLTIWSGLKKPQS